jgi:uncharacterized RDD family membrane protein YckC
MRCPKCGYTSFDHLESCKKCGKDLVEFKERFGITSVLFPGQMSSADAEEEEYNTEVADAAVVAATATAASITTDAAAADATSKSSENEDFGFDFMGDSAEDDDLSFDELFEEAPEDEDIEETIEGPKDQAAEEAEDFSFDLPEDDAELDDDFGFDPADEKDGFSFADDEPEDEVQGSEEDPKSPFDLPESPVVEGAPVTNNADSFDDISADAVVVEKPEPPLEAPTVFSVQEEHSYFEAEDVAVVATVENLHVVKSSAPLVDAPLVDAVFEPEIAADPVVEDVGTSEDIHLPETKPSEQISVDVAQVSVVSANILAEVEKDEELDFTLSNRVLAFVCDILLLCLVGGSFVVVAEAAMSAEAGHYFPTIDTLIDLSAPYFLVLFSLAFGYFTLFHFLTGQTPGKMLTGIRVETEEGEPLDFAHAFLRSVGGLLQALPLGLGYLAILFSAEGRGWNDRLAGTRVVSLNNSPEGA